MTRNVRITGSVYELKNKPIVNEIVPNEFNDLTVSTGLFFDILDNKNKINQMEVHLTTRADDSITKIKKYRVKIMEFFSS